MTRRSAIIGTLVAVLAVAGSSVAGAKPLGHFMQFAIPTPNSEPRRMAAGPDGALWFTEFNASKIGRITTSGAISEFPVAGSTFPFDIALGPDGRLWFTESEGLVGAIDPATGRIRQFVLFGSGTNAAGITAGPDGAVWFTVAPGLGGSGDAIGRITSMGMITEFPLPSGSSPSGIATGSDGALWFTEPGNGVIGRMTTSGTLTTFSGAGLAGSITAGPDGNLWFTTGFDQNIGRITTAGVITQTKPKDGIEPEGIATGPDGNIWFTEVNTNRIGEFILPTSH